MAVCKVFSTFFNFHFFYILAIDIPNILQYNKNPPQEKISILRNLPIDFFLKLCIIEVGNNTGSLAEGIISADPGTPLFKK